MKNKWLQRLLMLCMIVQGVTIQSFPVKAQSDDLDALNNQVTKLYRERKYAQAIPLSEKYMEGIKAKYGDMHIEYAYSLNNLAYLYVSQRRFEKAEPLYKRALVIHGKEFGAEHPRTGNSLNNLAYLYESQGRYDAADPLYKRALAISEKAFGPEHPDTGTSLNNLATLYHTQGRYDEAEPLYKRALAIREKALGPKHRDTGYSLNNLAESYRVQGRYDEAEPLYKRALAISEKALGPAHPDTGSSLNNLAELYRVQGRYDEAEPLYKRALVIREKELGPEHPDTGTSLNNLAGLYSAQGRYDAAEPLYKRALTVREKAFGPEHPGTGKSLNSLAVLYYSQGRYDAAELLYKRVLSIFEKALGPEHPYTGTSLNNLAELYRVQGRFETAEPLYKRALAISEKVLGPEHPSTGIRLNNLAGLYKVQGRYDAAEPLYKRALAISEKALGPEHPDTGSSLNNLAELYRVQGRYEAAYKYFSQGNGIYIIRSKVSGSEQVRTNQKKKETAKNIESFIYQVSTAHSLSKKIPARLPNLKQESFLTAQWAFGSEAAKALSQMAARSGTDNAELVVLVRERQDKVVEWQRLDKKLVAAVSKPPKQRKPDEEANWRESLKQIEADLSKNNDRFKKDFQDYAALVNPEPLTLAEAQKQLKPDEALVSFLLGDKESYAWVITKDKEPVWVKLPLGDDDIAAKVQALRCGLDGSPWKKPESRTKCQKILNVSYSLKDLKSKPRVPLPFSLNVAHELYEVLFSQVKELIKDKHLLIVADGALTSLPFQVLVAEKPAKAFVTDQSEYRQVAWLGSRHAITVLPSVPSLKALRNKKQQITTASNPYIGFGNPLLSGKNGKDKRAWDKQSCSKKGANPTIRLASSDTPLTALRSAYRGTLANVKTLKHQSPLPETTDELCTVAQSLGVPESNIYLGKNATETKVKSLNKNEKLKDYRYIHFATHGLLSGELKFQAEPALILTPPDEATQEDDGLLTASEITNLKLNADWVILSACNTAAGEKLGAEPFSGLARAFFYAGAKALLVSHWAVDSDATVKLITASFDALKQNPKLGRAQALRQSMQALMNDTSHSWNPHPSDHVPCFINLIFYVSFQYWF